MIIQTKNWVVTHRNDSRYLGYLIISSIQCANELHQLNSEALNELGNVLGDIEKLLIIAYTPYKVMIAKLGFSKGFNCHFHLIPVTKMLLSEITAHPNYTSDEPDGNDALLFVSREYCEKPLSEKQAVNIKNTVKILKKLFQDKIQLEPNLCGR